MMSLSRRETQEAAERAAHVAQSAQLEEFACNYQGWYVRHEIPGRMQYQKVIADRANVSSTGYEKALNDIVENNGVPRTAKLAIGDIDRYIANNNDGSLSSTMQTMFLVVGAAVHPTALDPTGVKTAHFKTLKAKLRRSVGNMAPEGDQLLAIDRNNDTRNENLLLVVTPIKPDQGKITLGVLLMNGESSEIATLLPSTATQTSSVKRTEAWKANVSKALGREVEAIFTTPTKIAHYRKEKSAMQLVPPHTMSLKNELLLLAALYKKTNDISFLKEAKDLLKATGKEPNTKFSSATHLIRFVDHEEDFEESDTAALLQEVTTEWPDIEDVTELRLWQLRKGIEVAKPTID